jgi:hypothetical protein
MQLFGEGSLKLVVCLFFVKPYKILTKFIACLTIKTYPYNRKMEVKPAEFARMAGVSRASISEKIKNKTLIVNAAAMLDTDNPVNAAYLSKHRQKQAEQAMAAEIKAGDQKSFTGKTFSGSGPPLDDAALILATGLPARELLNMTMREIVTKYPGIDKIERYSKILKETTMTAEKEQRIQERGLTLISKDFTISRLFAFIDDLINRLIEYPESAVDKIIALAISESETTRIDIVETMADGISRIIAGSKKTILSELNSLKNKYQKEIQNHDRIEEIKEAFRETLNE